MFGQLELGFGNREGRKNEVRYMYLIMLKIGLHKVRWRLARG